MKVSLIKLAAAAVVAPIISAAPIPQLLEEGLNGFEDVFKGPKLDLNLDNTLKDVTSTSIMPPPPNTGSRPAPVPLLLPPRGTKPHSVPPAARQHTLTPPPLMSNPDAPRLFPGRLSESAVGKPLPLPPALSHPTPLGKSPLVDQRTYKAAKVPPPLKSSVPQAREMPPPLKSTVYEPREMTHPRKSSVPPPLKDSLSQPQKTLPPPLAQQLYRPRPLTESKARASRPRPMPLPEPKHPTAHASSSSSAKSPLVPMTTEQQVQYVLDKTHTFRL